MRNRIGTTASPNNDEDVEEANIIMASSSSSPLSSLIGSSKKNKNKTIYLVVLLLVLLSILLSFIIIKKNTSLLAATETPGVRKFALANNEPNDNSSSNNNNSSKSKPKSKRLNSTHHCLNEDFHPKNTVGVWTMLNDNMDYVKGAAKLGLGVRAKTKTPLDLIVLELKSKPLGEDMWKILRPAGYIKCSVNSIQAPAKTRWDLAEKFAVLHVWAMTIYETIVFLDADTFVQNSIDDLIHMDLKGKSLGVTKDIREKKWVDTFNSGVMLIHPNKIEYKRLVDLLHSGLKFDFIMSDQGMINSFKSVCILLYNRFTMTNIKNI